MSKPASGRRCVLATRPRPQNDTLVSALEAAGITAVACPLFALESVVTSGQVQAAALLERPEVTAIFVSPAAARFGIALVDGTVTATCVAVGDGTASALRAEGVAKVLRPSASGAIGSEAVLAMAQMQSVQGQPMVIVQGDRPRGLLQQELRRRGAEVFDLTCYRRTETEISSNEFMDLCLSSNVDALIVSSLGAWRRVQRLTDGRLDELRSVSLIAISDRVRDAIDGAAWRGPVQVSNGANADAIVAVLQRPSAGP